jgi:hypothetical protein
MYRGSPTFLLSFVKHLFVTALVVTALVVRASEEFCMSMSTFVRSVDQGAELPTTQVFGSPSDGAAVSESLVEVMFPLVDEEEWPPYPAEVIDAVLIAHDLAEIRGIPWFVTNISRGDIVRVGHDGIGYIGGAIVSRGGHSTVHVMATSEEELAPIVRQLSPLGVQCANGLTPPMLTIDVPESTSLDKVLDVLTAAESMTCAYTVASRQHRARASHA